jgi:hypothetical protein
MFSLNYLILDLFYKKIKICVVQKKNIVHVFTTGLYFLFIIYARVTTCLFYAYNGILFDMNNSPNYLQSSYNKKKLAEL